MAAGMKVTWYSAELKDVLQALKAHQEGFDQSEAMKRLREYGPNKLPQQPPLSVWRIILR